MGQRRRYLFVCTNRRSDDSPKGSCAQKGSDALLVALKSEIARAGLGAVEVRACGSTCLDQCATGPTVLVEPDHFFYGRVLPSDVAEIVQALRTGERVERLVLTKEDIEGS